MNFTFHSEGRTKIVMIKTKPRRIFVPKGDIKWQKNEEN
jgi:hypothetical protein